MWWFFAWLGLFTLLYHFAYVLMLSFFDGDPGIIFAEYFGKSPDVLRGKIIWITGASSGIGEKLAVVCAKHGAKLVLSARRKLELERVKADCLRASGNKIVDNDILILPFDVTDTDAHQRLFDEVINYFGSLDILVNNAGRSQRAIWENIDLQVDREMFNINIFGLINMTRIAVRYFLEKGSGHIAVTSSGAGLMGVPFSGTYTATKHALHGYYHSLQAEKMDKDLTVTVFCPGPTFSNFLQESFTEKPNEKFGETTQPNDKRMTTERCAELFAIALANRLREAWVTLPGFLWLFHINAYYPNVIKLVMRILGPKGLLKIRDSRVSMEVK